MLRSAMKTRPQAAEPDEAKPPTPGMYG